MACCGFLECVLKTLNFLLTITGLAMIGYGVYLLAEWIKVSSGDKENPISPIDDNIELLKLGRPMLLVVSLSSTAVDEFSRAWFIYLFIGIGVVLLMISCFGCIGATTRNGCCLSCYSFLVILLILVELGAAAFIFFDHHWKEEIPADKTGDFDMIYNFLNENWKIAKWVALGAVLLEATAFLLALIVRAVNQPADYDSDDEYINPRSAVRQPLINRQSVPASGVPALENRPIRNDAWSKRMREKFGLDISEFTYNPSDPSRLQQATITPAEKSSRCTIL
ncbi:tobamovirus multiplication protein 2A-like [Typha angustifolia]|uniref:tobamovirus multiplication protein 2A-like n=1 Tax=Typha angustifolia TaxID=59011 RepID=UPI003C2B24BD